MRGWPAVAAQIVTGHVLMELTIGSGRSMEEVAKSLGLTIHQLGRVIVGTRPLTFGQALRAADLFGLTIEEFAAMTQIQPRWWREGHAPSLAELERSGRQRVLVLARRLAAEGRPGAAEALAYIETLEARRERGTSHEPGTSRDEDISYSETPR